MSNEETIIERRKLENLNKEIAPLIPYFKKKSVNNLYIYSDGMLQVDDFIEGVQDTGIYFTDAQRKRIIRELANINGIVLNDFKLPRLETVIKEYDIRTTAIMPPWTQTHEITFRRPAENIISLEQYVRDKRLNENQYTQICDHIKGNKNIVISGGTGSGKTTFTNACLEKMREYFPQDRFYIVEDVPELRFTGKYYTKLLIQSFQAVEAIKTALRWTPKHIIFGELRDGEMCAQLLEAWNTGHPGNITTIHANSAQSTVSRIEGLLRQVTDGKIADIAERIDVIIHINYIRGFGPVIDEVKELEEL